MAYAYQQSVNKAGSTSSTVVTTAGNFSLCDLLVVSVGLYQGSGSTPLFGLTIADSLASGSWTALTTRSGSNRHVVSWYKQGVAGTISGATQTFTVAQTAPSNYTSVAVIGFSGSAASPLDQQGGATVTTNTTTATITPSVDDCLLVSCAGNDWDFDPVTCKDNSGGTTWNGSVAAPTQEVLGSSGDHVYCGVSYRILSGGSGVATGAQWFSNSGSPDGAFTVVSFKPATGGGGGSTLKGLPLTGVGQ